MSFEQQIATLQDVERYRAEARAMQSRETARLVRRLFGVPGRLLRRAARQPAADRPTVVRHA